MTNLKEIVINALKIRNVGPQIIAQVDTLIQRSVIRLAARDLFPARRYSFTSGDKKQELRDQDGVVLYNYYYLPTDFKKLDEFRPINNSPYIWTEDVHELYQKLYAEQNINIEQLRKRFKIVDINFEDDSKYEKILIAFPFPADTEEIEILYYPDGTDFEEEWIDSTYWEAIIADIEEILGIRSKADNEDETARAVSSHKERKGHNLDNKTFSTLRGNFFGNRRRNQYPYSFNNGQRNLRTII